MGRYIVLGSGSIGRRHYENLTHLGAETELVPWRGLALGDLERKLADVTGVVVATATAIRLDPIHAAIKNGAALFIEKPLAYREHDLAALTEVTALVAERSVAGFMMRYHPAVRDLHDDPVDAFRFHFEIGHDVRQWRQNWNFADSYASKPEGGGVLLDLCHEIDLATVLFPGLELTSVQSTGHKSFPGVDFASQIALARGAVQGVVAMDYLSDKFVRRLAMRGRDGGLDLDLLNARQVRWQGGKETTRTWEFDRNEMFLGIMRDFMALAEERAPSDNPLLPRLDRVSESNALIAKAWGARNFTGQIEGGF